MDDDDDESNPHRSTRLNLNALMDFCKIENPAKSETLFYSFANTTRVKVHLISEASNNSLQTQ